MALTIEDITTFADGLDHPECIAVHPDGSVWAGGEAGQIYRVSADGSKVEEINNTGGFVLGIAFSPNAEWLAVCDLKNKGVWKLTIKNNHLEKFSEGVEGENFKTPNFPVFDSKGKLYVSDSGEFRKVNGKIFCLEKDGKGKIWHSGPFSFANGMALSANQKYLFVVCTWLPGVERIEINSDGTAGKREIYATIPRTCPDGIALDNEGNLYVSCYAPNAIFKVNSNREVTLLIDDWEGHTLANPTNMAFGGVDFKTLFTANLGRWHVNKITMEVVGLKLACH